MILTSRPTLASFMKNIITNLSFEPLTVKSAGRDVDQLTTGVRMVRSSSDNIHAKAGFNLFVRANINETILT